MLQICYAELIHTVLVHVQQTFVFYLHVYRWMEHRVSTLITVSTRWLPGVDRSDGPFLSNTASREVGYRTTIVL